MSSADALGRVLAEASADFVCLATSHGEPFYLNPAGRRLVGLGRRPAGLVGQPARVLRRGVVGGAARRGRARRQQDRPLGRPQPAPQRADRRADRRRDDHVPREVGRGRPAHLPGVRPPRGRRAGPACGRRWPRPRPENAPSSNRRSTRSSRSTTRAIITEFNRAAEQTFGHPREKVLGTKPSDVLFPPADQRRPAGPHRPLPGRRRGLDAGPAGRGHGGPRQRRDLRRRNGHDHQPRAGRARADVLHPRHQPPEEGRAGAGPLRRRAGAVEPRAGAVRLRRLARSPGAAAEDPHLRRPPANEVRRQARRGRPTSASSGCRAPPRGCRR